MTERAINAAKVIMGEIITHEDMSNFLAGRKGTEIRELYSRHQIKFECYECEQPLIVVKNKPGTVFLKHHSNSCYCPLKEEDMTQELSSWSK